MGVFDLVHDLYRPVTQYKQEQLHKLTQSYADDRFERSKREAYAFKQTAGDHIVAEVQWQLDHLGVERHANQIRFHELFLRSCLPKIYESEWAQNYDAIMKRFNIQKLHQETLVVCPRRFGKTYSVAMFVAAYLMHVPKANIAIFSTGKRTAGKLMALCYSFLSTIPTFNSDHVTKKTVEECNVTFGKGDERTLCCYPGTVKVCFYYYDGGGVTI
jgi:hypothetical protein